MLVRSMKLSDCEQVKDLFQTVLSERCYEETIRAFARQLSWDGDLILVAEDQGNIVGAIIGTIDKNQGFYYRIAVDAKSRGKGIGKTLIKSLKSKFLQRKVSKIFITVDIHNEPILPLYESAGYNKEHFSHSFERLQIISGM